MKKFKIVVVMPCWGRVGVVQLVSNQLDLFCEKNKEKVDIEVVWIVSPEDPNCHKLDAIFTEAKHTRTMVLAPNNRLGQKLNIGIEKANELGYDYLMNIGSDDFLHESLIDTYIPYMEDNNKLFGLGNLYFYNRNGETLFFEAYNKPYIVGAGRMIHKDVVDAVIEKYGCLYIPELRKAMDGNSANRMIDCGFKQTVINTGDFPMLVDIKSGTNITGFSKVAMIGKVKNNIKEVKKEIVEDVFPALKQFRLKRSDED